MGKSKKQVRKSTYGIIILSVFSLILLGFTVNNFLTINKEKTKNKKLNVTYSELKNEKSEKLKIKEELVSKYDEANNVDDKINKMRDEVFDLAKKVEDRIGKSETKYKIAYITFDDGPYHSTDTVLDTLKKHKVKATFFTIGLNKDICFDNRNYSCKETYKKIVDNGHTIANHTYSHQIFYGLYSSTNSFMEQVKKQENMIKERTGVTTNILRFPGGSATANALCGYNCKENIIKQLKENGYGWVDWTAQDGDGGSLTSYDVGWKNFTGSINENIEVVLFHDYNNVTISLLPDAIDYLEKKDYILLPLFHDSVKVNK